METTTKDEYARQIDEFEKHYQYDASYMRKLLETSPSGYEKFNATMPLVAHQELLDAESYWVARLAAMKSEDCSECLQLNVRMALEAGINKEIITAAVKGGHELPDALKDIYQYTQNIARNIISDDDLQTRIDAQLDKGQQLELGICISMSRFFPTTRRAAGYSATSCQQVEINV